MKLILRFLKPHWKLCVAITLLMIIETGGAMLVPTFAGEMLNKGSSADASFDALIITGIKMVTVSVLAGTSGILSGYACAKLAADIGVGIRESLYKKTLDLSVSDFQKIGTASMTTRTVSDVSNIQLAVVNVFQLILPVPVIFIVAITLAFSTDWIIGLILTGFLLAVILCALIIFQSASPVFIKLQKLLDKMSKVLLENITGVRVIRAFNKEEHETRRLNTAFEEYKTTAVKANKMFASLDGWSYLAVNMFAVVVYWISGARITVGIFRFGDVTAVIEYAMLALYYLMMAQMLVLTLPRAFECANRVNAVLSFSPEITDKTAKFVPLDKNKDVIAFENVSFRYADADVYALKNLNFSCKKGTITGIVGGTGSGKSTIASLMLRFNDVTDGSIKLNGVDIREIPQKELRDNVSYVQQNAWLFSGTIAENLRYGNPKASDKELWNALDIAQARDFVRCLPNGLYSFVAQGGTNFSGGQKQRLSIARAIVENSQVYLFDDCFSALDFKTDAALRKALISEKGDKAMVIITQRISSVMHADQIIVIDKGYPVGVGTHEELLKNCKVYSEIYESQTKAVSEK